jgi:hypothetical protein
MSGDAGSDLGSPLIGFPRGHKRAWWQRFISDNSALFDMGREMAEITTAVRQFACAVASVALQEAARQMTPMHNFCNFR